jgi:hypothetical protein
MGPNRGTKSTDNMQAPINSMIKTMPSICLIRGMVSWMLRVFRDSWASFIFLSPALLPAMVRKKVARVMKPSPPNCIRTRITISPKTDHVECVTLMSKVEK